MVRLIIGQKMKSCIKRIQVVKLLVTLSILFIPLVVLNAGGVVYEYLDGEWIQVDQEAQFCAINYEDCYQRMILGISLEKRFEGERVVWIFPVPAKPEKVEVCSLGQFPVFLGFEVEEAANYWLAFRLSLVRLGQVYPMPEEWIIRNMSEIYSYAAGEDRVLDWYIQESRGLFREISSTFVSFEDEQKMIDYLDQQNIVLPKTCLSPLSEYLKKEYSFVIASIEDVKKFNTLKQDFELREFEKEMDHNFIGIHIRFPSSQIFYPLRSAGINRGATIPVTIYIIGFVDAAFDYNLKGLGCITHMFCPERHYWRVYDQEGFYKPKNYDADLKYTKIDIFANSVRFGYDFFIEPKVSLDAQRKYIIYKISGWYALAVFFISSCLASLISWRIVFKRWLFARWKLTLYGLFNIVTIVGFSAATYLTRTKEMPSEFREKQTDEVTKNARILSKKHLIVLIVSLLLLGIFGVLGKHHLYAYLYSEICDTVLFVSIALGIVLVSLYLASKNIKEMDFSYTIVDYKKLAFLLGFNILIAIIGGIFRERIEELLMPVASIVGFTYETDYGDGISFIYNFTYLFALFKLALSIILLIPLNILFVKKFRARGIYIVPKDNRKILFVVLFSITFVILTYIFQFALKALL